MYTYVHIIIIIHVPTFKPYIHTEYIIKVPITITNQTDCDYTYMTVVENRYFGHVQNIIVIVCTFNRNMCYNILSRDDCVIMTYPLGRYYKLRKRNARITFDNLCIYKVSGYICFCIWLQKKKNRYSVVHRQCTCYVFDFELDTLVSRYE